MILPFALAATALYLLLGARVLQAGRKRQDDLAGPETDSRLLLRCFVTGLIATIISWVLATFGYSHHGTLLIAFPAIALLAGFFALGFSAFASVRRPTRLSVYTLVGSMLPLTWGIAVAVHVVP